MGEERRKRVADLYLAGKTPREIAAEVGCSIGYIQKVRNRYGIPPHQPRLTGDEQIRKDVVRRYNAGQSAAEIASATGVPKTSVYRCLRVEGVALRRSPTSTEVLDQNAEDICREYAQGRSMESIAMDYGCSAGGIRNVLLRNGVTRRSPARKTIEFSEEEQAAILDLRDTGATCEDIAKTVGRHYAIVNRFLRQRDRHKRFRRPRVVGSGGYIYVRNQDGESVMEHRHVMSQSLGRLLQPYETVHHINGDITDNRLENLQLRQGKHGKGVVFTCNACGSHDVRAVPLS